MVELWQWFAEHPGVGLTLTLLWLLSVVCLLALILLEVSFFRREWLQERLERRYERERQIEKENPYASKRK